MTITAKISDLSGLDRVILSYQPVAPGMYIARNDSAYQSIWLTLDMQNDGLNGDAVAGDGIYSVQMPDYVQVHRMLVRYRIFVINNEGSHVEVPYADDPQANLAYFVYDGVPSWRGAIRPGAPGAMGQVVEYSSEVMTSLPVYQLISKRSDVEASTWRERYGGSDYKWQGTLVYDGRVYDHVRYRARGGVWRYAMGKNMWKFDFNRGHEFQAHDDYGRPYETKWRKLNFSACIQQGDYQHRGEQGIFEAAAFRLFNMMGVEAPKTSWLHFRVIDGADESGPTQYDGDFWGLYMTIEQMGGRFLKEHGLPDGNLCKMEGGTGELNNQGSTAATNKSDLNAFMGGYRSRPPETWWRQNVNLESYYGYRCVVEGVHHGDIGYGKNYFFYLNPETNLWSQLPWDLDLTWAENMYGNGEDPFKGEGRVLLNPNLNIEYQNRLREFMDLLYNTDQAHQLLDELANVIDPPTGGPTFVDADRALWDYNPIMTSGFVNPSKAGQGRFYQRAATKDFRGMVQIMKDYVVFVTNNTRNWHGWSGPSITALAADQAIPQTPVITATGPADFPTNALTFRTSPFADPQGAHTFAAMKWRIAEVCPSSQAVQPGSSEQVFVPGKYEIDAVWETGELDVFDPDVLIPASVVEPGRTYRVRCRMKDNTGRWSNWSAPVQFQAGRPISVGLLADLRITELMYNPAEAPPEEAIDNNEFEFIELKNVGAETLDLSGVSLTRGVRFDFASGDVTTLGPGGFVLVVRNKEAFLSRYGPAFSGIIAGEYEGRLSNSGETVTLEDFWSGTIAEFTYSDGAGWPIEADGPGHSLVPLASAIPDQPFGSLNYGGNWRASTYIGGSPGADDPEPVATVVLNEFMAGPGADDWIELYNPTDATVSLADFYLSDDLDDLKQWAIGVPTIGPHGFLSFDEASDGLNFGLSRFGEQVLLSYLPGTAEDRVVDILRFQAQEQGVSKGRYPDGGPWWFRMAPSRNGPNIMLIADVVIDEIMYHPADGHDQYIELFNPTGVTIELSNSAGPWRLSGEIEYTFKPGMSLEPGARLVVIGFDPLSDLDRFGAFLTLYTDELLVPGVDLVGPWQGNLANAGGRLVLERPVATDDPDDPAWVLVDEVIYSNMAPWPTIPAGSGDALQRVSAAPTESGNDPANWQPAAPTPGLAP